MILAGVSGAGPNLSNFFAAEFDSAIRRCMQGGRSAVAGFTAALRRALPQACALCAGDAGDAALCARCTASLPRIATPCPRCALASADGGVCADCTRHPPPFAATRAAWIYAFPVDRLLQALKYRGRLELAEPFAEALSAVVTQRAVDALVALPLSRARQRRRGFNQAHEIARRVAARVARPLIDGLYREVDSTPQADLAWRERAKNVRGAFSADPRVIAGRSIAVVDDVMTTGATLRDAARALQSAGAIRIEAWVVARTPPPGRGDDALAAFSPRSARGR
jgi:ComF family protein